MRQGLDLVRLGRLVAPAAAVALAAAMAGAQSEAPVEGQPPDEPKPLLSGPPVEDDGPPGIVEGFGSGAAERMMGRERLPGRVLHRILEGMLADDAPEDVRLTDEQRQRVREFRAAFEEERLAYMREHAEEMRQLRRRGNVPEPATDRRRGRDGGDRDADRGPEADQRPRRQDDGQRPGRPDRDGNRDEPMDGGEAERDGGGMEMDGMAPGSPPPAREQEAARRRLREVMAGSPGVEKLYADVWEILTEPQQAHVEAQIARFHEGLAERRREQYVERQMRDMRGRRDGEAGDGSPPGPEGARRPMANAEARRARLIEIFNGLSPEEQVRLIDRLERAMADRRPARQGGPGGRGPAGKPAPGVDGVDVPEPEERAPRDRRPARDE